jgi:nucleoside-diphosphate-sugar epimerase
MTSLVIGGNGALGRAVVSSLKKVGQKVLSLDITHNSAADMNVLINPEHSMKE